MSKKKKIQIQNHKFLLTNINLNLSHKESSIKRKHVNQLTGTRAYAQCLHECPALNPDIYYQATLPLHQVT